MGSHFRMKTAIKIIIMVIFMMTPGEANDDLENIVKEMRMEMDEMKGCLAFTKENLKATQAELVELKTNHMELKEDLKIAKDDLKLTATKEELTATKEELKLTATKEELKLTATKEELSATRDDLTSKDHELERDVSIIRNPPFIHSCGSHSSLSITSQTIPYDSLLYSSTNTEGGGLDIATGVFTSPWPGSYTVTWSLTAQDGAGEFVHIYLRKNGQNIDESLHKSYYTGPSGEVGDQGGRTLVLHLDMGDTLDLYSYDCSAAIYRTTFCVSL